MKNLSFALCFFFVCVQALSQEFPGAGCDESAQERCWYKIHGVRRILQIKCPDGENFFFFSKKDEPEQFVFVNEGYKIHGRRLRVVSAGEKFFVVKRKWSPERYQYNSGTKSWSFDRIKDPGWRTGNREGP